MTIRRLIGVFCALAVMSGCAVNPVTGKREITLVSEAGEIQLGEQNYRPMQQAQGGVYDIDHDLTEYVSEVGQRLAAVSDRPLPYEFVVLNSSVPNAWALPGGKIAINRGLLTELGSEAELAAVLGHEIVHAAARHSARQMERGMLLQGLVVATAVATSDSDYQQLAMGGRQRRRTARQPSLRAGRRARVGQVRHALYGACRLRPARRGVAPGNLRATERRPPDGLVVRLVCESSAFTGACRGESENGAATGRDGRRPRRRTLPSRHGQDAARKARLRRIRRRA